MGGRDDRLRRASDGLAGVAAGDRGTTDLASEASAMIVFMSAFGAEVIVFHPGAGRLGESLPLGTRGSIPGAETLAGAGVVEVSTSSIMNISSSGIPVATGLLLNVGRSIGLLGADASERLMVLLLGPGGDSFGESLNAPARDVGAMGCGMSCRASQSPQASMALSTMRLERERGYFLACAERTNVESCLTRSGARSSSIRLPRKTSMLTAMYSWTSRTSAVA